MRQSKRWGELEQRLYDEQHRNRCLSPSGRVETQALRRRVADGSVVEPFPRLFAPAEYWSELRPDERCLHIIRALADAYPEMVFCSHSAALVHGLPVSYRLLDEIHCLTSTAAPSQSRGLLKRHSTAVRTVTEFDGIRVMSLVEAAIDSMLSAPFTDALAVADGLLRSLVVEREVLQFLVAELAKWRHGAAAARRVAEFADGRSESGGESIARAVMIEAGVTPSDIQPVFTDPVEPWRAIRPDFLFRLHDGLTILGELDGLDKYDDAELTHGRSTTEVLVRERQRESHLTLLGMPVVRFTMRDVRSPGRLAYVLSVAGITPSSLAPGDYRMTGDGRP